MASEKPSSSPLHSRYFNVEIMSKDIPRSAFRVLPSQQENTPTTPTTPLEQQQQGGREIVIRAKPDIPFYIQVSVKKEFRELFQGRNLVAVLVADGKLGNSCALAECCEDNTTPINNNSNNNNKNNSRKNKNGSAGKQEKIEEKARPPTSLFYSAYLTSFQYHRPVEKGPTMTSEGGNMVAKDSQIQRRKEKLELRSPKSLRDLIIPHLEIHVDELVKDPKSTTTTTSSTTTTTGTGIAINRSSNNSSISSGSSSSSSSSGVQAKFSRSCVGTVQVAVLRWDIKLSQSTPLASSSLPVDEGTIIQTDKDNTNNDKSSRDKQSRDPSVNGLTSIATDGMAANKISQCIDALLSLSSSSSSSSSFSSSYATSCEVTKRPEKVNNSRESHHDVVSATAPVATTAEQNRVLSSEEMMIEELFQTPVDDDLPPPIQMTALVMEDDQLPGGGEEAAGCSENNVSIPMSQEEEECSNDVGIEDNHVHSMEMTNNDAGEEDNMSLLITTTDVIRSEILQQTMNHGPLHTADLQLFAPCIDLPSSVSLLSPSHSVPSPVDYDTSSQKKVGSPLRKRSNLDRSDTMETIEEINQQQKSISMRKPLSFRSRSGHGDGHKPFHTSEEPSSAIGKSSQTSSSVREESLAHSPTPASALTSASSSSSSFLERLSFIESRYNPNHVRNDNTDECGDHYEAKKSRTDQRVDPPPAMSSLPTAPVAARTVTHRELSRSDSSTSDITPGQEKRPLVNPEEEPLSTLNSRFYHYTRVSARPPNNMTASVSASGNAPRNSSTTRNTEEVIDLTCDSD
eukprot:scaffold2267_cov187-Ochromonas_danica.AAC.8